MATKGHGPTDSPDDVAAVVKKPITRRDFLKVAGGTGAVVAASGGLGGVLAACGSSSPSGGSSSGTGRTIKIGFVSPQTGSLAAFGAADQYAVTRWKEAVGSGIKCGDGQVHPIEFLVQDSQSDSNRAATVAGDLITNDNIDIMLVTSSPDTVNPVADQAEALQVPCISNDCPWQPYYFGRGATPAKPFKWTYHFFWGLEDITAVYTQMWDELKTNKLVGEMWPNDADGLGWANAKTGQPSLLPQYHYKWVDGGRFPDGTQDYTPQISKFKSAGVGIVSGVFIPPDFVNFWRQAYEQGLHPHATTIGKALLFPAEMEAIGKIGYGLTTENWWSPYHPFKSSLSGETCKQLADDWTKRTGKQWAGTLLHYGVFEVAADALKRTTNVDDKEAILSAIVATDMQTIAGHVTWSAGAPLNPVKNVCRTVLVGGQWVKGTQYPFDLQLVNTKHASEAPFNVTIPETGKLTPLTA